MEAKAKAKFIRMSPKKVRLVANLLKGLPVQKALVQLEFVNKWAKEPIAKLLNSAIANAEKNFKLDKDSLVIKSIIVNQGPVLKRWQPHAHGRATEIRKRMSHIEIVLEGQSLKKEEASLKKTDKKEDKKEIKKKAK